MRVFVHDVIDSHNQEAVGEDGLTGMERYERYAANLRASKGAASATAAGSATDATNTTAAATNADDRADDDRTEDEANEVYGADHGTQTPAGDSGSAKPLSGRALFIYRQTHGGKDPPVAATDSTSAPGSLGGAELFRYRMNHAGQAPGQEEGR